MPIACLALAALAAFAVDVGLSALERAGGHSSPSPSARCSSCSRSTCGCRCSARSPLTSRTRPTRPSAATVGCSSCRLPPGPPLRERLPRLRAPEPAGAPAGLLDACAPRRRPARPRATAALVRSRRDPRRSRRAVRCRPPRPLRAECVLRPRLRRQSRGDAARRRLAASRPRRAGRDVRPLIARSERARDSREVRPPELLRHRRQDVVPDRGEAPQELRHPGRPPHEPEVEVLAAVSPAAHVDALYVPDRVDRAPSPEECPATQPTSVCLDGPPAYHRASRPLRP